LHIIQLGEEKGRVTFAATSNAEDVKEAKVMTDGRFISYLRVSTARQGRSGLGLEAQREAVSNFLNGGKWKLIEEVVEVESGKRSDRPKLTHALLLCRLHKAKLVVAKLDRLSRNLHFLTSLMESKVPFVAADLPDANNFTVHILAAVAEHEAKMISARTKAALQAAKRRGTKLGGKRRGQDWGKVAKLGNRASAVVRQESAVERNADYLAIIQNITEGKDWTLRQIAEALNERGIETARGNQWSPTQVMRVMQSGGAE
jgi:DNA invertase Pin-like site-specific DNA recombinase